MREGLEGQVKVKKKMYERDWGRNKQVEKRLIEYRCEETT